MTTRQSVDAFIAACCRIDPLASETAADLYLAYWAWAVGAKVTIPPGFFLGPRLRAMGFRRIRDGAGRRCYCGLALSAAGRENAEAGGATRRATWRRARAVRAI
jgi:hypothetical protein